MYVSDIACPRAGLFGFRYFPSCPTAVSETCIFFCEPVVESPDLLRHPCVLQVSYPGYPHHLISLPLYCVAVRTSCILLLVFAIRLLDSPRLVMKLRPSRPLAWHAVTTHAQDWRVMSRVIGTCSSEMRWLSLDVFFVLVHVVIMRPSFRAACACSCGGAPARPPARCEY